MAVIDLRGKTSRERALERNQQLVSSMVNNFMSAKQGAEQNQRQRAMQRLNLANTYQEATPEEMALIQEGDMGAAQSARQRALKVAETKAYNKQQEERGYQEGLLNKTFERKKELKQAEQLIKQEKSDLAKIEKAEKMSASRNRQYEVDFKDLSKTINDPSSRRRIGKLNANIDAADAITVLANSLGEGKKPGETVAQRVARFNHADARQVSEIVKSLDRLLSQAAPTIEGQRELKPHTFEELAQKFGEKVTGSPRGVNQGQFIERIMETVERERKFSSSRKRKTISQLASGYEHLREADPEKFKRVTDPGNLEYQGLEQDVADYSNEQGMAAPQEQGSGFSLINEAKADPAAAQRENDLLRRKQDLLNKAGIR